MTDCLFEPPVILGCTSISLVEIDPLRPPLPPIRLPCIPGFTGTVQITSADSRLNISGSSPLRIIRDPASECGFALSGSIHFGAPPAGSPTCVVDADAFRGGGMVTWFNNDGIKTTANEEIMDISGSIEDPGGTITFRFWKCHKTHEPPDRTVVLPAAGGPGGGGSQGGDCDTALEGSTLSVRQVDFSCAGIGFGGWYDGGTRIFVGGTSPSTYGVTITGKDGGPVEIGVYGYDKATEVRPGIFGMKKQGSPDAVYLTVDQLPTEADRLPVSFREFDCCVDGEPRKVMLAASKTYEETP